MTVMKTIAIAGCGKLGTIVARNPAGRFVKSRQKILRRDYSSYNHEPDKIHYLPVWNDCIR